MDSTLRYLIFIINMGLFVFFYAYGMLVIILDIFGIRLYPN